MDTRILLAALALSACGPEAVAATTALPVVDYRAGYYCGQEDCTVPPEGLTSADKAAFLATTTAPSRPEVDAAIRARQDGVYKLTRVPFYA